MAGRSLDVPIQAQILTLYLCAVPFEAGARSTGTQANARA